LECKPLRRGDVGDMIESCFSTTPTSMLKPEETVGGLGCVLLLFCFRQAIGGDSQIHKLTNAVEMSLFCTMRLGSALCLFCVVTVTGMNGTGNLCSHGWMFVDLLWT